MTVQKTRYVLEEPHPAIGPEFDLSEYKFLNRLKNSDAIAERVRYAALVSALRETRVLAREAQTPLAIRRELLTRVDEAIGVWFEMRQLAPDETGDFDVEGESSSRTYLVFANGTDEADKLTIEIFERLA